MLFSQAVLNVVDQGAPSWAYGNLYIPCDAAWESQMCSRSASSHCTGLDRSSHDYIHHSNHKAEAAH